MYAIQLSENNNFEKACTRSILHWLKRKRIRLDQREAPAFNVQAQTLPTSNHGITYNRKVRGEGKVLENCAIFQDYILSHCPTNKDKCIIDSEG